MIEAILRGWENFIARASEPLSFRFIIQPTVAIIIAFIAGLRDAKKGNPPFLWAMFTNSSYRRALLHEGWKDICTPFIISLILDSIYQLISHQSIYLLELLFTAFFLALMPYLVFRDLFNRIAQLFIQNKYVSKKVPDDIAKKTKMPQKTSTKKKR